MIQRLQSLLLLFAAIANLSVLFMKLGDASSNESMESPSIHLFGMRMEKEYLNEMQGKFVKEVIPIKEVPLLTAHLALVLSVSGLAFIAIFLYKKRSLQLRITYFALVAAMVQVLVSVKLFMDLPGMIQAREGDPHDFGFALFLPALAILLLYYATRRIKKDEKMVRDMDRIR